jgi:23S rRNA (uridine2552-2'-O)-methyltransferase
VSKKGSSSGGLSRGGSVRVRTANRRSAQSTRWLARQLNDPYVHKAKQLGYRSRAAFKLLELDESYTLLRGASRVVDLGAAPGGWCQVVHARCPKAHIVAIDVLSLDPLPGVVFLQQDFLDEGADQALIATLGGLADVVLSDMAANTTGHKQTDHLRTMALCEAAVEFATRVLKPGGHFVAKVLAGGADKALVATLKTLFTSVKHAKPPASRKDSSEWYVIAQGFKGPGF